MQQRVTYTGVCSPTNRGALRQIELSLLFQEDKSMRRILALIVVLCMAAPVLADDLFPPDWRGDPGSTFQHWTFDNDPAGSSILLPDVVDNPFGQPELLDNYPSSADWYQDYEGRQGVYHFYWNFWLDIPNQPLPNPLKWIQVQITWWDAGDMDLYDPGFPEFLPDESFLPTGEFTNVSSNTIVLEGQWKHTTWLIEITPNVDFESLFFQGLEDDEMIIDQIVVDTICIPSPGALALLGLAGLAGRRRR